MIRKLKKNRLEEDGFALLESIVFLFAFLVLAVYVIDFFSIIHTGVVDSIGARTYLFETLQHRADIHLLRGDDPGSRSLDFLARGEHERFHGINDEELLPEDESKFPSVGRVLTRVEEPIIGQVLDNNLTSNKNKASIIQVKSGYGICIDAGCPGDGG